MRWRIPLLLALVAFVAVSCDQQPVGPADGEVAQAPTFNFMNGPELPGNSQVNRLDGPFDYWVQSTDPDRDLYAFHHESACGEQWLVDWDIQFMSPGPPYHINGQAQDQQLYIYDMSDLFDAAGAGTLCEFLEEDWLFRGTHDMRATENWTGSGLFQMTANGFVWDPDGNRHSYREHQRYTSSHGWTHEDIEVN
jgi:hypothetical protein